MYIKRSERIKKREAKSKFKYVLISSLFIYGVVSMTSSSYALLTDTVINKSSTFSSAILFPETVEEIKRKAYEINNDIINDLKLINKTLNKVGDENSTEIQQRLKDSQSHLNSIELSKKELISIRSVLQESIKITMKNKNSYEHDIRLLNNELENLKRQNLSKNNIQTIIQQFELNLESEKNVEKYIREAYDKINLYLSDIEEKIRQCKDLIAESETILSRKIIEEQFKKEKHEKSENKTESKETKVEKPSEKAASEKDNGTEEKPIEDKNASSENENTSENSLEENQENQPELESSDQKNEDLDK